MSIEWRRAAIVEAHTLTPSIRRVVLTPKAESGLFFRAGQHVLLRDRSGFESPFSIASPPSEAHRLEFLMSTAPQADRLFWQAGEVVEYAGPFGSFSLDANATGHLFVATGSGIAPIRSMILDRWRRAEPPPGVLLLGHRTKVEVPYYAEWRALAEQVSSFSFIPIVTREEVPDIRRGRVTDLLAECVRGCPGWTAYISGRPELVSEARTVLQVAGVPPSRIRAEFPG